MLRAIVVLCLALVVAAKSDRVNYPEEYLPEGNTTLFAMVNAPNHVHWFARGQDGGLYHRYFTKHNAQWTNWILRSTGPKGYWNGDPAAGMTPEGTIEVYIRYSTNLDVWQIYQLDAKDPDSWSKPRESSCVDLPCNDTDPTHFWNTQPIFPTSDLTMLNDPADGHLQMWYRGFNGALFVAEQKKGTHQYNPPKQQPIIVV